MKATQALIAAAKTRLGGAGFTLPDDEIEAVIKHTDGDNTEQAITNVVDYAVMSADCNKEGSDDAHDHPHDPENSENIDSAVGEKLFEDLRTRLDSFCDQNRGPDAPFFQFRVSWDEINEDSDFFNHCFELGLQLIASFPREREVLLLFQDVEWIKSKAESSIAVPSGFPPHGS